MSSRDLRIKRRKVQDVNNEIKTEIIPSIETKLQQADAAVNNLERSIFSEIEKIEEQRHFLKTTIDSIAEYSITDLKNVLKKYKTLFQQFKSASEDSKKRMQDLISENIEALNSNQNIEPIDVAKELKETATGVTNFDDTPLVEFICGSKLESGNRIKEAFGYTLNTRKLSFMPDSIDVTKNGTILFNSWNSDLLRLVDAGGDMHEIKLGCKIRDIAVHPVSDILYCVTADNDVRTIDTETGYTTQCLVPEERPFSLAFMNDGTLILGDLNNDDPIVTLYSPELKTKRTFTYKGKEPEHISVCKTTGRIAFACRKSHVLVVDSHLTEMYRYKGPPGDQGLASHDVIFDGNGHLLVADFRQNKGVHIVNAETGQHLKTLTTGNMGNSKCLAITPEGRVVVGTRDPSQLLTFDHLNLSLDYEIYM